MPRFDNENELLEKLRDSAGKMKIWTEYTQKGLENTRYEIINGMVILKPHYGRISGEIAGNLNYLYHKSLAEHYLFTNFDVKIDDDNIFYQQQLLKRSLSYMLTAMKLIPQNQSLFLKNWQKTISIY